MLLGEDFEEHSILPKSFDTPYSFYKDSSYWYEVQICKRVMCQFARCQCLGFASGGVYINKCLHLKGYDASKFTVKHRLVFRRGENLIWGKVPCFVPVLQVRD